MENETVEKAEGSEADRRFERMEMKLDEILAILRPPKIVDVRDSVKSDDCKHRNRMNITTFGSDNELYYCRDCGKMVKGSPIHAEVPATEAKEGK
jgi:hypothetical protein